MKPLRTYSGKKLALAILSIAAAGALIATVAVAPGMGLVFKSFGVLDRKDRFRFSRKIHLMQHSGYLKREKNKLVPTDKGRRILIEEEVWNEKPPIPKKWDGKWRLVLFDIPLKKERARQALRARLIELGYQRYQNSVFLHRYDMRPLVEKFAAFYGIREHLRFVTASSIDREQETIKRVPRVSH